MTRAQVEGTLATDVTGLLKKNAALDVIQYPGLLSGVSVRGFRPQFSGTSTRTLVLVDGRPAGLTNLATLDLAAVERVEVLKGPASALYGSSAMGGVVNVVTRTSTGPLRGTLGGSYGSFGSYRGTLAAGGALGAGLDLDLSLAAAGREEGYRTGARRILGGDPERADTTVGFSEFATRSASARLGYALGERWRATARGAWFVGDGVQNPGDLSADFPFPSLNDLERRSGEVGVAGALEGHAVSARLYVTEETTSYWDDATEPTFVDFRSPIRWYGAQLQDVLSLGAHTLTVGADYAAAVSESESFSAAGVPSAPYNPDSETRSTAAFAEARLALLDGRLAATLGGRLDRIVFEARETPLLAGARPGEETHTVFNPSGGLLYRLGGGVQLHGSAGRAFVTPDAFYVAGYVERSQGTRRAVLVTQGNPALEPESSTTWDAGATLLRPERGLEADLTYFRTRVRDRIATVPIPVEGVRLTEGGDTVLGITGYRNVDRSRIEGVEGRVSLDFGAWRLFATGTRLLRAEEVNAGEVADITHVADLTVNAGAEYDAGGPLAGRLSARYVGERTAPDYNEWQIVSYLRYPRFLVLDLSTALRVGERYRLSLELENLGNESHYEILGYDLPGRSVRVGVEAGF